MVSAMDVGDSHFVEINPKINQVNLDMMKHLRPEYIFLNDVFAALTVSVHDLKDPIRRARLFRAGMSSLEEELIKTAGHIIEVANLASEWGGNVEIKWSNHDDMLYRWLAQKGYEKDNENKLTAYKILAKDPGRDDCFEKAIKFMKTTV